MGLQLDNNYLLVTQVEEKGSEFAAVDRTDKYQVAFTSGKYKKGMVIFAPGFATDCWLTVEGKKYQVVKESEVVAHVA